MERNLLLFPCKFFDCLIQITRQKIKEMNKQPNRSFRLGKSRSPARKTELDLGTDNINDIANINKNNIMKVKEFMESVTSKSKNLKNKKISAIKNANSLQVLKKSGFFNFEFFENKSNKTHFNITLDEIEKVFRLIDKKNSGSKITQKELENKMKIINPDFPLDQIGTLTNNKGEIKATELYDLLKDNELADFDPISEVYNILDVNGTGDLDVDHLQQIFEDLGMGKMDEKDKHILKECLTLEGEDKITKESFKTLFSYLKDTTEVEPIQEED